MHFIRQVGCIRIDIIMIDWIRTNTKRELEECDADNGVKYLYYPSINELGLVKHAFSTRVGGVSLGYYGSLNFSFTRGDRDAAVRENYRRMAEALGISDDSFVVTFQTHTTNIRVVTHEDKGKGVDRKEDYMAIDGLITNEKGITLTALFADCIPIFLIDPVKRAIGLAHSGRAGTRNHMARAMINKMSEVYGSKPSDIVAGVGPGICKKCYEVENAIADDFKAQFDLNDRAKVVLLGKDAAHKQLDLLEANRCSLRYAGLLDSNIHIADICTCDNNKYLFSHRCVGDKRGNLAAFLAL